MGSLATAQQKLKKLREEVEAERAIRRSEAQKSLLCKNVEGDSSAEDEACKFIDLVRKQIEEIKEQNKNNYPNPIVITRTLSEKKDFNEAIMTKNGWKPTVDAMKLWLRNTYEGLIAAGCKIEISEDNTFSNQKGTQTQYKLTITL